MLHLFQYSTFLAAISIQWCCSNSFDTTPRKYTSYALPFKSKLTNSDSTRGDSRIIWNQIHLRGGGASYEKQKSHSTQKRSSVIPIERKIEHQRSGIQLFPEEDEVNESRGCVLFYTEFRPRFFLTAFFSETPAQIPLATPRTQSAMTSRE